MDVLQNFPLRTQKYSTVKQKLNNNIIKSNKKNLGRNNKLHLFTCANASIAIMWRWVATTNAHSTPRWRWNCKCKYFHGVVLPLAYFWIQVKEKKQQQQLKMTSGIESSLDCIECKMVCFCYFICFRSSFMSEHVDWLLVHSPGFFSRLGDTFAFLSLLIHCKRRIFAFRKHAHTKSVALFYPMSLLIRNAYITDLKKHSFITHKHTKQLKSQL